MSNARFTILQKGLLLIGVPILFQLVFVALFLRIQSDAIDTEQWARHTKDVIAQAETAYRQLLQAFSDTRGEVLLGTAPEQAAASHDDPLGVRKEFDRLCALVADNPDQLRRTDQFRSSAVALIHWLDRVTDLLRQGKRAQATALVEDNASVSAVNGLRDQLRAILDTEQALDAQRMADVHRLRQEIRWFLISSILLALLVATGMLWGFSRGISSRMASLAANAKALGERQPLGPPIGGTDEITDVDRAFHNAAVRLDELNAMEQQHRDELERRATELDRVNQDLSAKTRENETFVYSVSHDLRSPLVNLQGFSRELAHACEDLKQLATTGVGIPDDLRRQIVRVLDGDVAESVKFIQTAVTRSAGIIDALLRLSRAGRVEYNWAVVAVRPIVVRIVQAMQATVRQRGAEVVIADQLPDAFGDATAIEQILGNLIGNAVNYLDPMRPGRIEVGALPEGDPAAAVVDAPDRPLRTYFVRDNGVGIPAAYVSKIFIAFQRLHGQMAPGEGIGLALVRRMVERHGGKIWVDSIEGQGSTFFVVLPTPPPPPVDDPGAGQPAESAAPADAAISGM